jgi:hypothetical protein
MCTGLSTLKLKVKALSAASPPARKISSRDTM